MNPRASQFSGVTPMRSSDLTQHEHRGDADMPGYHEAWAGVQVVYFWIEKGARQSTRFTPRDTITREPYTSLSQAIERYDPFQWADL